MDDFDLKPIQPSFTNDVISRIQRNLLNQLNNAIIEGLKRKGYEFNNNELEQFVKQACKVVDNIYLKQKVYFVNGIPFFLHNYNIDIVKTPFTAEISTVTIAVNFGTYAYL